MIDPQSNTVILPSGEIRKATHDIAIGDNMYGDNPTVDELETRAVELIDREVTLFAPSGTMGNQVAARVHAGPRQKMLVDEKTHVCEWEVGDFAQLSGLQIHVYDADGRAVPTPTQIHNHTREESLRVVGTDVLYPENTHNACGGVAISKADTGAATDAARDLGIPVHPDGARLFSARVAFNEGPAAIIERINAVICCLSKGLDAPIGSMLADPETFIRKAVHVRKQFGSGIRQTGLIVAPGLVTLDNVDRLTDNHANATVPTEGLDATSGLSVLTSNTSIVVVDSEDAGLMAEKFVKLCDDIGVLGGTFGQYRTRSTTNLNVSRANVERAVNLVASAVESWWVE